jgi:GNAT superfamily N-acetyltransferase
MNHEWQRGEYLISTDRDLLNVTFIHNFLSKSSYWGKGRSLEVVQRSIEHSLNFGLYKKGQQIGFARVVTDHATFAWLADVFLLNDHRGIGLGKWLIEVIVSHQNLQGLRRWLLATKDAHNLYSRFGFRELSDPGRWMERFDSASEAIDLRGNVIAE